MNISLQGERTVQNKDGMQFKRSFVCVAEGIEGIRVLGDYEEIHLKSTVTSECLACGLLSNMIFAHYEEQDHVLWDNHPRRCNFAYVP